MDPLHIFGFAVAHVCMLFVVAGFIIPRAFDVFIPVSRRPEHNSYVGPQQQAITNGLVQESTTTEGAGVLRHRTTAEDDGVHRNEIGPEGIYASEKEAKVAI